MMNLMNLASSETCVSPVHAAALKMADFGFPVFPLHGVQANGQCTCGAAPGHCKAGKHPRRMGSFKEATTNKDVINVWFKEKGINYGVRTGAEINNSGKMLVVVDVDCYKDGGTDAFDALISQYGPLPDTAEVLSGAGGRHLFFLTDLGTEFRKELCENVDIKAGGGYTVGAGSMHVSGKRYDWEGSSDLFEGQKIAPLPQWVIDVARKPALKEQASLPSTNEDVTLSEQDVLGIKTDLADIPSDDYHTWIEVLMALKSLRADNQAFEMAVEWSSKSQKYNAVEMRGKWESIDAAGGIGIGTIARLANQYRAKGVDLSKLLARLTAGLDSAEFGGLPMPLTDAGIAEPYPVNALPLVIRDAVIEVQEFVQAPMAMVACSAMATLSLAAQGLYDVERASSLSGPISLFFLTVADSGERKSSLDNYFSKPVAKYEQEQAKAADPLLIEYSANMAVWDAKKTGLADAIKKETKAGNSSKVAQAAVQMREHEADKPLRPPVPRLVYSDTTPEALARGIATE